MIYSGKRTFFFSSSRLNIKHTPFFFSFLKWWQSGRALFSQKGNKLWILIIVVLLKNDEEGRGGEGTEGGEGGEGRKEENWQVLWLITSSVQSLGCVQLFATPWITARQASLSITNSRSLLKPMSIELVMPSSHLILCRPLLLLPPIPPSIRVFSNESTLHTRWPKYWCFSFCISPSNEHPGLISFRMVGYPCSPRDSQESFPSPQFKIINSLAFSFFYSPTLTSIHDHWKNHSLDQTDPCWQSNVCLGWS